MLYGGWNFVQNGALTGQRQWGVDFPDATTAKANGWFPDLDPGKPVYDPISQSLTTARALQGDVVMLSYTVGVLDSATITANRAAACQTLGVQFEAWIDSIAQARGYKDAATCASYYNDPNLTWAGDARALVNWRSAAWAQAITIETAVMAGTTPLPTIGALASSLPVIVWPS